MRSKPEKIETEDLCCYGCGKKAKYRLKNGKLICESSPSKCPINKQKNSKGVKKAHEDDPESFFYKGRKGPFGMASEEWREKNREKEKEIRKKQGETYSNNIKEKKIIPSFLGKKHTKETKQKISNSMGVRNNGLVKTKWYKLYSPYMEREVSLQGSWEYKYALYLNNNNIKWEKTKKKHLSYKLFEDDYVHYYYPDFYLPESDSFIEVKGYYWKSTDGRVDDKRKMEAVLKYNSNRKIIILEKEDLKNLGIKL